MLKLRSFQLEVRKVCRITYWTKTLTVWEPAFGPAEISIQLGKRGWCLIVAWSLQLQVKWSILKQTAETSKLFKTFNKTKLFIDFRAVSLLLLSSALLAVRCNAVTHEVSGVDHGRIESPGYPEPYENNEEVIWTITVEENYKIELFFTVFDLEDSYDEDLGGSCVYDFVQVYLVQITSWLILYWTGF